MKSTTRATGRPGGLAVGDSLSNFVSGMGTSADKSTFSRWAYRQRMDWGQCDAAYQFSWLYRRINDLRPTDMTREWRAWDGEAQDVEAMVAEEKRLGLQAKALRALSWARLRGGAAILMGLPGDPLEPAPASIGKGDLMYLHVLTRQNLSVSGMNTDLADPLFGQPSSFYLSSSSKPEIHPSRVVVFPGLPLPELAIGASEHAFWGAPLLESIDDALKNAETSQQGIASLIHEMKADILGIPNLMDSLGTAEYEARLMRRVQLTQQFKSMYNTTLLDSGEGGGLDNKGAGGGETWETRQLSFANLPETMMAFFQLAAAAAGYPVTKLLGTSAKGMNATGEGDADDYDDSVRSDQKNILTPKLDIIDGYLRQSAQRPAMVGWSYNPLEEPDPLEQSQADQMDAAAILDISQTGTIPLAAFSKAVVSKLDKRLLPGLSKLVDENPGPLPAQEEADLAKKSAEQKAAAPGQAANANSPAGKAKPAAKAKAKPGAGGHTIKVTGPGGLAITARTQRAANDGFTRDAAPRTLYVSRKIKNPQEILNWAREQGISGLLAASDLHVTIAYSREAVDWMKIPADWNASEDGTLRLPAGGARLVTRLGDEGQVIVLQFASQQLEWRHEQIIAAGATWDWPSYEPHISLSWDAPADLDVDTIKPYQGRILLGPEIFAEVVENWRSGSGDDGAD